MGVGRLKNRSSDRVPDGGDQPVVLIGQSHRHAKIPVVKALEGPAVANEDAVALKDVPLQARGRFEVLRSIRTSR